MGLKDDIYNSLVKNLGEDNVTATPKSQEKVDTLAQDLTDSIITFIQAQEFTITSMALQLQCLHSDHGQP